MHESHLNDKLNLETARIHWEELQAHFARGAAVFVDNSLDLIDTARLMADNNSHEIGKLMAEGKFGLVTEQQARQFLVHNQEMWAVVIAPWVLIQPCLDAEHPQP